VYLCTEKIIWWWCYPPPSEGWGRDGTPWRPKQSGHALRSGPEVKNDSTKNDAPERLRWETIQEAS